VNTAVAVQAAWHGGSKIGEQEHAQTGASGTRSEAISTVMRISIVDTDHREDDFNLDEE
jgi:hypothetical protein